MLANMSFPRLELFLEMHAVERDASPRTLDAYRRDLVDLAAFLRRRGEEAPIDETRIAPDDLAEFARDLSRRGLSEATARRRMAAVRGYFGFLRREGVRADDPSREVALPKARRHLPKSASREDAERLLERARLEARRAEETAPRSPRAMRARRQLCALELLYGAGLRISELLSLRAAPRRPDDPFLLIKGKGGHSRRVPLHHRARRILDAWSKEVRDAETRKEQRSDAPDPLLFPSRNQRPLTRQRMFQEIKALAVRAGINPDDVSPHRMRHAFATALLDGGADLRAVQVMLGHADIAATEIYTRVADSRLERAVRENHPLSRRPHAAR